jgi:hypothetical protein
MKRLLAIVVAAGIIGTYVSLATFGQDTASVPVQRKADSLKMRTQIENLMKHHPRDSVRIWLYGSTVEGHIVAIQENGLVIEEEKSKLTRSISYSEMATLPERKLPVIETAAKVSGLVLLITILLPILPFMRLFGGFDC